MGIRTVPAVALLLALALTAGCRRAEKPPGDTAAAAPSDDPEAAGSAAPAAAPSASGAGFTGIPAQIRTGAPKLSGSGKLPPEVIQRIVRQNFGRYRLCYQAGLQRDATLAGKVVVDFTIDRKGMPKSPTAAETTVPDAAVVDCVRRAFLGLSFPEPEEGEVRVQFSLMFAPGK